jgi:hypothetical protein
VTVLWVNCFFPRPTQSLHSKEDVLIVYAEPFVDPLQPPEPPHSPELVELSVDDPGVQPGAKMRVYKTRIYILAMVSLIAAVQNVLWLTYNTIGMFDFAAGPNFDGC